MPLRVQVRMDEIILTLCPSGQRLDVLSENLGMSFKVIDFSINLDCALCPVTQLCMTLWNPKDCSPPGSSVHGISQQEYWNRLPFASPGDLPDPGIEPVSPVSPALAGGFFTTEPPDTVAQPLPATLAQGPLVSATTQVRTKWRVCKNNQGLRSLIYGIRPWASHFPSPTFGLHANKSLS